MSGPPSQCQVCDEAPVDAEAVYMFGRGFETLIAAHELYADNLAWPSVWLCEACVEATAPTFAVLDELCPADALLITTPLLLQMCRLRFSGPPTG